MTLKLRAGDRVRFSGYARTFKVRAANERFAICTQPLNVQKTLLYTVIDWERSVRGPENLVFGMGAETTKQCLEMLDRLSTGQSEVSRRREMGLDIIPLDFFANKNGA